MKVKELVEMLNRLDQELEVLCYTEDSELLPEKHRFRLLDIGSVKVSEGERVRDKSQVPTLKLGRSLAAEEFALISVTSDF